MVSVPCASLKILPISTTTWAWSRGTKLNQVPRCKEGKEHCLINQALPGLCAPGSPNAHQTATMAQSCRHFQSLTCVSVKTRKPLSHMHNLILYSIWRSQNTFTLQAWAFRSILIEVMRGKFKPPSGCLSNINAAPIWAQVPIPFPSRAPLSGFGKLRSEFLNCLSRARTHTNRQTEHAWHTQLNYLFI